MRGIASCLVYIAAVLGFLAAIVLGASTLEGQPRRSVIINDTDGPVMQRLKRDLDESLRARELDELKRDLDKARQARIAERMKYHGIEVSVCESEGVENCWFMRDGKKCRL